VWANGSQVRQGVGDYLILIDATDGDEKARMLVPLRVVP
jgi:hypothetical protein